MGLSISVYKNCIEPHPNLFEHISNEEWIYTGEMVFGGVQYAYSQHSEFIKMLLCLIERRDLIDQDRDIKWNMLTTDIPFYYLVNQDNKSSGFIRSEYSKKLFLDFKQYENKAKENYPNLYHRYQHWMETFGIAQKNGIVAFR